jgi:Zn-dependent protease
VSIDPVVAIVFYLAFVFSATVHEAAHAWAAKRGGDPTAYLGGQVSLDPRPHIRREPMGMLVLPVLSVFTIGWPFGFASAPYDAGWARRHPRRAAWMALAGPAANLALVVAAALLVRLGLAGGMFAVPESVGFAAITAPQATAADSVAALVVSVFFSLNLVLFSLNLIPLPPLDGSGAIGLLLPEHLVHRYQDALARSGIGWVGILIAWWIFPRIFQPLFLTAVNLLYPEVTFS